MAGSKAIRTKIKSVQSTRKITKAMEMVSAAKMKKAQDRMRASRPYVERALQIALHIAKANTEYKHPFLAHREAVRRVGAIVVTTDKGLCGGLNTNVLRLVLAAHKEWRAKGLDVDYVAIGNKGLGFLQRLGANVVSHAVQLGDRPHLDRVVGPVKVLLDEYAKGRLTAVYLCYTRFINTMKQEQMVQRLLPLSADAMRSEATPAGGKYGWDYIYEPDAPAVIDELLIRYVEGLAYQATVENAASEQAARMVAMKSATDNAGNVIAELKLVYNKTRQAGITKELSEIVAGAAAV